MIMDYKLVNRSFYMQIPKDLGDQPVPLLIALHAQGFQADSYAGARSFGTYGEALSFVTVFPQGLDDAIPGGADLGTGWNVGTAGAGAGRLDPATILSLSCRVFDLNTWCLEAGSDNFEPWRRQPDVHKG